MWYLKRNLSICLYNVVSSEIIGLLGLSGLLSNLPFTSLFSAYSTGPLPIYSHQRPSWPICHSAPAIPMWSCSLLSPISPTLQRHTPPCFLLSQRKEKKNRPNRGLFSLLSYIAFLREWQKLQPGKLSILAGKNYNCCPAQSGGAQRWWDILRGANKVRKVLLYNETNTSEEAALRPS